MSHLTKLSAEVGQFLIPVAAGSYAIYNGDYSEAALFALCAAAQKMEIVFLKTMFPRTRPNGSDDKSFPSGHTAGAFLGVGLLAAKYGLSPSASIAFSGASLVAFSRYISKHHWPTDILAGASIGLINGFLAGTKFFYSREKINSSY